MVPLLLYGTPITAWYSYYYLDPYVKHVHSLTHSPMLAEVTDYSKNDMQLY